MVILGAAGGLLVALDHPGGPADAAAGTDEAALPARPLDRPDHGRPAPTTTPLRRRLRHLPLDHHHGAGHADVLGHHHRGRRLDRADQVRADAGAGHRSTPTARSAGSPPSRPRRTTGSRSLHQPAGGAHPRPSGRWPPAARTSAASPVPPSPRTPTRSRSRRSSTSDERRRRPSVEGHPPLHGHGGQPARPRRRRHHHPRGGGRRRLRRARPPRGDLLHLPARQRDQPGQPGRAPPPRLLARGRRRPRRLHLARARHRRRVQLPSPRAARGHRPRRVREGLGHRAGDPPAARRRPRRLVPRRRGRRAGPRPASWRRPVGLRRRRPAPPRRHRRHPGRRRRRRGHLGHRRAGPPPVGRPHAANGSRAWPRSPSPVPTWPGPTPWPPPASPWAATASSG